MSTARAHSLAARLAPHCTPGPVLDLLAGTVDDPELLPTAPSDDVAWRLYRGMDATAAAVLVEKLTSPPLLARIASRDRRIAVRIALARNTALPDPDALRLAAIAADRRDTALAEALRESRSRRTYAHILLTHPTFPVEDPTTELAWALHAVDDDPLTLAAVAAYGPALAAKVVETHALSWGDRTPQIRPETMLAVTQTAAAVAGPDVVNRDPALKLLLPEGSPIAHQRRCLTEVGGLAVARRLVTLASAGQQTLPLVEILTRLDPEGRRFLAHTLADRGQVVDTAAAALLDDPDIGTGTHQKLTCTADARALLAASAHPQVAAAHLMVLAAAHTQVSALESAPPAVQDLAEVTSSAQLCNLWRAGLSDTLLLKLVRTYLGGPNRRLDDKALRDHLLTAADDTLLLLLRPTREEASSVLARADLDDLRGTAHYLVREVPDLPEDVRRAAVAALSAEHLVRWLLSSDAHNRPVPGDWSWLWEHAVDRVKFTETTVWVLRLPEAGEVWAAEAAATIPLPWTRVHSAAAYAHLREVLAAAFGDDVDAWAAVLRIAESWVGTSHDLVDVVRAVRG